MPSLINPSDGKSLDMWVVYRYPRDYPDKFVARRWVGDEARADEFVLADKLGDLQAQLIEAGRIRLERMPGDDAVIVEVWL
jgi:hypothetical protein